MGINKVQYGNTTLIDLTSDTVTADKLMQGYTAHDRTGALITGTATGGGSGGIDVPIFEINVDTSTPTITCDETFEECSAYIDGLIIVNVYHNGEVVNKLVGELYMKRSSQIIYTVYSDGIPAFAISYLRSGAIKYSEPASTVRRLQVTENGDYNADYGTVWNEVNVNVPSGSSKNTQIVQSTTRTNASTLTAIGAELTVSKTGTYDIYYSCFRTNTSSSYTWATRLYINGTAYGTAENTTWTNNQQNTHLSNISLTDGDKLRVYGRNTRGTSYYVCAPTLAIVEA